MVLAIVLGLLALAMFVACALDPPVRHLGVRVWIVRYRRRRRALRSSRPTLMPCCKDKVRWQKLDRAAWRQRGLLDGRTWGDA